MSAYHYVAIAASSIFVILYVFQCIVYVRSLSEPLRSVLPDIRKRDKTERLYLAYRALPEAKFRNAKLKLKAQDHDASIIYQAIELLSKLVFSIAAVFLSGMLASLSLQSGIVKDSAIPDKALTYSGILQVATKTKDMSIDLLFFASLALAVTLVDLAISRIKKSAYKQHLVIVEEIEKEQARQTPPPPVT